MKITTMKRMRMFLAMALGLALTANAGDLAIQSFNGTGQLTFNELTTAQTYRVEWAPAPSGPVGRHRREGYPISSEVYTTRQRTIVPDSVTSDAPTFYPWDPSQFEENGYGLWHYGSGIDYGKDRGIMPAGYDVSSVNNAASLLSFLTMSDTHVYDKESPSQPFYALGYYNSYESGGTPAITFTMLYTTHILDAAIQTVNALHKQKPFDCGLFLGDACNNSQYNELRWYLDVIDGKLITPSSGGHFGADTIDYQKPYQAAGLDKTIPWYQTKGSHDNFWFGANLVGTNLVGEYLRQNYIGEDLLRLGLDILSPPYSGFDERTYYMGTVDGTTRYGDIIGAGAVSNTSPITVVADPNRHTLNMKEWMTEYFDTSSNPVGHGFTQTNIDNDFASYSFDPKSNIPIKIIMLDDTQSEIDYNPPIGYGNGSLDQARYYWLISELEKGQAEGKLMIIAAHVPIGVQPFASNKLGSWGPESYIQDADTNTGPIATTNTLIATLHKYPNLILWLAGHMHYNQVTPFPSPDPNHPELGFWEVQTPSLRDFPQQFRTFEIVRNSDKTISIIITDVDPAVRDGSPAAMSRFYAVAAMQLYKTPAPYAPACVYNAELIKQLSPEMQTKIQHYGKRITPVRVSPIRI
jgi:metallophosphoesterase (TIGR03768 family)